MTTPPDTDNPTQGEGGVIVAPLELSVGTDHGPQQRRNHMLRDGRIPRLLSTTGASKVLGISRQRLHVLIEKGVLPAAQAGGYVVLAEETVQEFAARRQHVTEDGD